MGLPALITELPADFRADIARLDLVGLETDAIQKLEIATRTDQAAENILFARIAGAPEYEERVMDLVRISEGDEAMVAVKTSDIVKQIAGATQTERQGVSDQHLTRDLLTDLHPDKQTSSLKRTEELKTLTAARKTGDTAKLQLHYARNIAGRHALQGAPVGHLEGSRYKAWTALNAVDSKFTSVEEVEAWEVDQIARVPYRHRQRALLAVWNITVPILGVRTDNVFLVSQDIEHIMRGCQESVESSSSIVEDDSVNVERLRTVDLHGFDQTILELIGRLEKILSPPTDINPMDLILGGRHKDPLTLAAKLHEAARKLDVKTDRAISAMLGSIALAGMLQSSSPRPRNRPQPTFFDIHETRNCSSDKNPGYF